ncbi:hypothetical protein AB6A40_008854 [Gnathostoma spinigerum]|uniref:Uncharacterized protein n=1 Tax=Gnathostoma spinigerum TaxID=75299 RepID=A0ABD6EQA0_9BILA
MRFSMVKTSQSDVRLKSSFSFVVVLLIVSVTSTNSRLILPSRPRESNTAMYQLGNPLIQRVLYDLPFTYEDVYPTSAQQKTDLFTKRREKNAEMPRVYRRSFDADVNDFQNCFLSPLQCRLPRIG